MHAKRPEVWLRWNRADIEAVEAIVAAIATKTRVAAATAPEGRIRGPMDEARADQIKRAMQAVEQAPQTESGLIIPPHVAAELKTSGAAAPELARPNRAQRRRQKKKRRR
jgi:hypothetical protein